MTIKKTSLNLKHWYYNCFERSYQTEDFKMLELQNIVDIIVSGVLAPETRLILTKCI